MRTDPAFIRLAVDKCLERLETDYIDVLQLHNAKMEHVRDAELWGTLRELQREGKIRAWGAAFGPAIGWLYEAVELVEREPDINTIQMIWNVLEQHPGTAMIEAAKAHAPNCCFNVRVTHASRHARGEVHRGHGVSGERPSPPSSALVAHQRREESAARSTSSRAQMTLGQAALKWLLAEPLVVTTLPNIYDDEQLAEFADGERQAGSVAEPSWRGSRSCTTTNFGVEEEPMTYKGTMTRESRRQRSRMRRIRAMINLWHDLPPGPHPPEEVTAVDRDSVGQPQQVRAGQGDRPA